MEEEVKMDQAWRSKCANKHFFEPTYSGALSFLRRPYRDQEDLTFDIDVAVTGVPFDNAVTYRPGARLGPRAIRAASVQLAELKAFPSGLQISDYLNVVDVGDCFLNPHDPMTIFDAIHAHALGIIQKGSKLCTFGGDHYIAGPLVKAHFDHYGPIALLHFDGE